MLLLTNIVASVLDTKRCLNCKLVDFDQHATEFDITCTLDIPETTEGVGIDVRHGTPSVPPAVLNGARARADVVVLVRRAEHPAVGVLIRNGCPGHGVTGVSAVPSHSQLILASLITDGERRVFSPVPQTVRTLYLHNTTWPYATSRSTVYRVTKSKPRVHLTYCFDIVSSVI